MDKKWFVLLLASFVQYGKYFILDMPGFTKSELMEVFEKENSLEKSEYYFSLLYSVYSFPNILLPLIGGLMSDNFGPRILTILFTLTIFFCSILFYFGIVYSSYSLMIAARFIFGLVGEILDISSFNIVIEHFIHSNSQLPIAAGFRFVIIKFAGISNSTITPFLSKKVSLSFCYFFSIFPTFFAFLCAILIRMKEVDQIYNKDLSKIGYNFHYEKIKNFIKTQATVDFWILTIMLILLYSALFTFISFSSGMMVDDWMNNLNISIKAKQNIAGSYITTIFLTGLVFTVLFSFLLSKYQLKRCFLILGGLFCIFGFTSFIFIHNYIPFILLGMFYSFFGCTIWPSFSEIIPEENRGLGFGIVYCFQNLGLCLCPIFSTFIKHAFGNNNSAIIIVFIFFGFASLFLGAVFGKYKKNIDKTENVYSKLGNYGKELEIIG